MSRFIANKCALAAKMDAGGLDGEKSEFWANKLTRQIENRLKIFQKYKVSKGLKKAEKQQKEAVLAS